MQYFQEGLSEAARYLQLLVLPDRIYSTYSSQEINATLASVVQFCCFRYSTEWHSPSDIIFLTQTRPHTLSAAGHRNLLPWHYSVRIYWRILSILLRRLCCATCVIYGNFSGKFKGKECNVTIQCVMSAMNSINPLTCRHQPLEILV